MIFERANVGEWGAYVPDLPGLSVAGETIEEAETLIREGIVLHISRLMEDGLPVPEPVTRAAVVRVLA